MALALDDWAVQHFENRVGEVFTVQGGGSPEPVTVTMELLEVRRSSPPPPGVSGLRSEPFTLLFRSVAKQALPQGLSTLIHEQFQPDPVYLVRIMPPRGMAADQVYYEGAFS